MELNAGRGPAFPQTPLSAFLLSLVPAVGQVGREEGGMGMLSGSGPSPSLLAPNHPSGCQCEMRAPEPLAAPGASLGCGVLFMGCEAKQLSWGAEGSEAQMEDPSFIDEVLSCHKRFLPAATAGGPRRQHVAVKN